MVLAVQEIIRKALDKGTVYLKKIMETDLIDVCEDAKEKQEEHLRQTDGRFGRWGSQCQKHLPDEIVCGLSLRECAIVSLLKNDIPARQNNTGKGIDIWYMVSERNYIFFSLVEEQSTTQKLMCLKPEKQTETRL